MCLLLIQNIPCSNAARHLTLAQWQQEAAWRLDELLTGETGKFRALAIRLAMQEPKEGSAEAAPLS
jgi:hypothetical protein